MTDREVDLNDEFYAWLCGHEEPVLEDELEEAFNEFLKEKIEDE